MIECPIYSPISSPFLTLENAVLLQHFILCCDSPHQTSPPSYIISLLPLLTHSFFCQVAHTTSLVGTDLFVFGGGDGITAGNSLYVYDTITLNWDNLSTLGPTPVARYGHSACVQVSSTFHSFDSSHYIELITIPTFLQNNRIFYFGGYSITQGYSNDFSILDSSVLTWEAPRVSGTKPPPRVGHGMVMIGSSIVIVGGEWQWKKMIGKVRAKTIQFLTPLVWRNIYSFIFFTHLC